MTVDQGSSVLGAADVSTGITGSLGGFAAANPGMNIIGGYGSVLDDLQVSLLIRATQARSDSKSVAAPKLTVLSGESATFSLTDMVSYALPPTTTQTSTFGGTGSGLTNQGQYQNVQWLNVGSMLSITPTISKDKKYVLLNIQTTQIDLLGFATHTVADTSNNTTTTTTTNGTTTNGTTTTGEIPTYEVSVPETETANVMTRVSVPDRGTLLLGGHKLAAEVDKEAGVPVLSKIPLLGRLFTNRSTIRDQRILLILVRPNILFQEETEQDAIAAMEEGDGSASQY